MGLVEIVDANLWEKVLVLGPGLKVCRSLVGALDVDGGLKQGVGSAQLKLVLTSCACWARILLLSNHDGRLREAATYCACTGIDRASTESSSTDASFYQDECREARRTYRASGNPRVTPCRSSLLTQVRLSSGTKTHGAQAIGNAWVLSVVPPKYDQ